MVQNPLCDLPPPVGITNLYLEISEVMDNSQVLF